MAFIISKQEMDNTISDRLSRICMRFGNCNSDCIHIVHLLSFLSCLLYYHTTKENASTFLTEKALA